MPNIYIIAGCNGAGKTTASFTVLPELLNCKEFVNADEIAKGLSPFQPESVALEAGRLMLNRIDELIEQKKDFAFETTLSTRSYKSLVQKVQGLDYYVTLVFFWLNTPDLAVERVRTRVENGGHNIPEDVIRRRYVAGIKNLFRLYLPIVDLAVVVNNSQNNPLLIAKKDKEIITLYHDSDWETLNKLSYE